MDIGKLDPNSVDLLGTLVSAVGDLLQGVAVEMQMHQTRQQQNQEIVTATGQEQKLKQLELELQNLRTEMEQLKKFLAR